MDLDIQVVHGVEEVGQAAWDRLGRGLALCQLPLVSIRPGGHG
jgi:hypothetical protein